MGQRRTTSNGSWNFHRVIIDLCPLKRALVQRIREVIDLFFEKVEEPCHEAETIVADEELDGGETLLETADVA